MDFNHFNQRNRLDSPFRKKVFDIPNITDSLRIDYLSGELTIEDVTAELSAANLIPFYDEAKAKKLLGLP